MNAIPTKYNGIQFRSRLEATWAAFFDLTRSIDPTFEWEYEPIDLKGYIPDFILSMYGRQIIVEVKPEMAYEGLLKHFKKIEDSGWNEDILVVGARLFSADAIIGAYSESLESVPGRQIPMPVVMQGCIYCGKREFIYAYSNNIYGKNTCNGGIVGVSREVQNKGGSHFFTEIAYWDQFYHAKNITQWRRS